MGECRVQKAEARIHLDARKIALPRAAERKKRRKKTTLSHGGVSHGLIGVTMVVSRKKEVATLQKPGVLLEIPCEPGEKIGVVLLIPRLTHEPFEELRAFERAEEAGQVTQVTKISRGNPTGRPLVHCKTG